MNTNVVLLKASQIEQASAILADAFSEDPMFRYLTSEASWERVNAFKSLCLTNLRYCQPYSHIYTTAGNLKGVAAWVPPGKSSWSILPVLPIVLTLPFKLGWYKFWRCLSLVFALEQRRHQEMPQPHWYLELLGVASACQGQGVGSLLLQPVLKQADSEGLPCYLVTSTPLAVRFYQKQGFRVLWQGEIRSGSPNVWTMKREPLSIKPIAHLS